MGEGPRRRPLFSSPQGSFATLLSQTMTASLASKSWVWLRHKQNAPASENVPRPKSKLPPPAFYMYLCVRCVFHVKNTVFFSNHIFAKFLLVFTWGACPQTIRPFWRVVSPGQWALVIQQGTQTRLGFMGHLAPGSSKPLFFKWCCSSHFQEAFPLVKASSNLTQGKYHSYSFCFLNKLLVSYIIKCSWL